uniref:Uncharacterized protein n=1 Tax=Micrurus lemniscatus lemniscatus TaxID=129467 RepID=A0A2D4HRT7_MICLE
MDATEGGRTRKQRESSLAPFCRLSFPPKRWLCSFYFPFPFRRTVTISVAVHWALCCVAENYLANCGINGQAALPDGGWWTTQPEDLKGRRALDGAKSQQRFPSQRSSHGLKVRFSRNELAGAAWTVSYGQHCGGMSLAPVL